MLETYPGMMWDWDKAKFPYYITIFLVKINIDIEIFSGKKLSLVEKIRRDNVDNNCSIKIKFHVFRI